VTNGTAAVAGTFNATATVPVATSTTQLNYEGILYASQLAVATTSPSSLVAGAIYGGATSPTGTQQVNVNGELYATTLGVTTTSPSTVPAGAIYGGSTAPTGTQQVNVNGYLYTTRVYNAVWNDLAEFMYKAPDTDAEPGDVLVQTDKGLVKSSKKGDIAAVGIYSDSYGWALGAAEQDTKYPVALAGVVYVKVREPLEIGDLLISDIDGYATKTVAPLFGTILGKVLESKNDYGTSRIKILVQHN
jgi:hypothetical protein